MNIEITDDAFNHCVYSSNYLGLLKLKVISHDVINNYGKTGSSIFFISAFESYFDFVQYLSNDPKVNILKKNRNCEKVIEVAYGRIYFYLIDLLSYSSSYSYSSSSSDEE